MRVYPAFLLASAGFPARLLPKEKQTLNLLCLDPVNIRSNCKSAPSRSGKTNSRGEKSSRAHASLLRQHSPNSCDSKGILLTNASNCENK